MRIFALALTLATSLACAQERSPYVLSLDRTPYMRAAPLAAPPATAAAGASAPVEREHRVQLDADRAYRARIGELEQRLSQLGQERDAWKRRADELEAELRAARIPLPPRVAPVPTPR